MKRHSPTTTEQRVLKSESFADFFVASVFLIAIALPVARMFFPQPRETFENRRLAELPPIPRMPGDWLAYPAAFEEFFDDHFGFRQPLIQWNNRVRYVWFGDVSTVTGRKRRANTTVTSGRPIAADAQRGSTRDQPGSQSVPGRFATILGKDNWFFGGGPDAARYYANEPMTPSEVEKWCGLFQTRRDWLVERGVRHLVVFCPNKATIYNQYVPDGLIKEGATRLDQLADALRERTDVQFVDLRPALRSESLSMPCYYRTDTHFTEYGAFVAYREIVASLQQWFPALEGAELSDFEVRYHDSQGGELSTVLGLADSMQERALELRPLYPRRATPTVDGLSGLHRLQLRPYQIYRTSCPDASLPKLLTFHDSFGLALIPFLAEHFSEASFDYRPLMFAKGVVALNEPDVVLEILVERRLATTPSDN